MSGTPDYLLSDHDFHCITCSDEALPARVLSISEDGMALVSVGEETREVDTSLLDDVAPGDVVLMHGGVVLAHAAPGQG